MCGICGIVDFRSGANINEALVRKMCAVLAHRGPDQEGVYLRMPAALGHRRLSIIDLESGDQPMSDDGGNLWIAYNGEVYNFLEERRRLEEEGVRSRTHSDTEVLLHLYQRHGVDMLQRLRGMFAFGLWDEQEERLFLARDRAGQKPLHYFQKGGLLVFASEIKAILEHPEVSREIDPFALDDYLSYNCVPPPRTMFDSVRKLPPAHFLLFDRSGVKIKRYWDVEFKPDASISFQEAASRVLEGLREATRLRMISDVPLGAFLSGGIDSSLVVAIMSQVSERPVKTFSIGFEEAGWSELPYARAVAERYGTNHREFVVKPEAIRILPKLIYHFDEPFADSSAIPTYYLAEVTRKHVTVALNGDGGDESFAGYDRYLGASWLARYRALPEWARAGFLQRLLERVPGRGNKPSFLRRMKRMNEASLVLPEEAYCSFLEIFAPADKDRLLGPGLKAIVDRHDSRTSLFELLRSKRGGPEILGSLLYADLNAYLPDDLLVKIDRMTMAHSLEGRSPLLDHHLIELAATLPAKYKLQGLTSKVLLKHIARDLIPSRLIDRPKMGFGVPMARWFRTDLKKCISRIFENSRFVKMGWLQREAMDNLWAEHLSGRRDHCHRIWGIVNLELWFEYFVARREIELEV